MNQASRGSRVVFVGNIPFELSEEQLIEVFKEVGPVASFRLLFDRDTGRPKGYGFCEFLDAETAASAVRNLNDYEIGGRQLRVDYAAMDDNQRAPNHQGGGGNNNNNNNNNNFNNNNRHGGGGGNMGGGGHHPPPQMVQPVQQIPMQQQQIQHQQIQQQIPVGKPPVTNMSSVDEISKVLASMNSQDLFTLMSQMKQMSFERADFTRDFLTSNPQVAYALFQAMVMMNIVDPNIITRIMNTQPVAPIVAPVIPVMQPMQPMQSIRQPIRQPIINSPAPIPNPVEDETEQQKALLMKVLQLTDDQINALPPQTRDQIRQLKTQLTMQQS
ncbi:uncharacterized protein EV154DRAFT_501041 [Mucor mucedo]|uniref:uncharacterized protein n=1 Tax=Mucor mucedo TaxID=29922 RepID=UPI002220A93C|nr:uncharacterized protein EV154DRAFT_501041 [Mucor mucedo]KAI7893635.1 hypothetical protein EV154DRAFT_501041 [Mucor mucedo]